MGKAILLTGAPGCGKTTLIRRLLPHLGADALGFYTAEIRLTGGGSRLGFELAALDGQRGLLAHIDRAQIRDPNPPRLGKYYVDLLSLEEIALPALQRARAAGGWAVVDEVGPMELYSIRFQAAVLALLDSPAHLLGTIVRRNHPFADRLKARPGLTLIEVTPQNREALIERILVLIRA